MAYEMSEGPNLQQELRKLRELREPRKFARSLRDPIKITRIKKTAKIRKGSKKYLRVNCLRTKGYNWRNNTIIDEITCISGMITL